MISHRWIKYASLTALALLLSLTGTSAKAFNIQKVVSSQGIDAWLVEDHTNPIIATEFDFRGGAALDPVGKAGLAYMTASLLDEGVGDMDSQTFQGKLEDLAISLSFNASTDGFQGSLKTLTSNRDVAFDMMRLSLTKPRFDADAV